MEQVILLLRLTLCSVLVKKRRQEEERGILFIAPSDAE